MNKFPKRSCEVLERIADALESIARQPVMLGDLMYLPREFDGDRDEIFEAVRKEHVRLEKVKLGGTPPLPKVDI